MKTPELHPWLGLSKWARVRGAKVWVKKIGQRNLKAGVYVCVFPVK